MKPDQPKLCECGCGLPAPIATKTQTSKGYVKGQPHRFILGHHARVMTDEHRRKIAAAGLGRVRSPEASRKIADANRGRKHSAESRRNMSIAQGGTGEPKRGAIHRILRDEHPKRGACEECGKVGRTEYAFQRHPEPYTLNRSDYRELCHSCHQRLDAWLRSKRSSPKALAETGKVQSPASPPASSRQRASEP